MNYADLIAKGYRKQPDGSWARSGMAGMEANQSKSAIAPRLAGRIPKQPKRKAGVELVVTLVACMRRELDSDNLQGACKPARDAIAVSLGLDDGDPRIRWNYAQVVSIGGEGIIVKMEKK